MKIKLLKEIDDKILAKIDLDRSLAAARENMKDIFGDNWRIIIPMVAPVDDGNLDSKNRDEMMLQYISEVETKTGYKVDFSQPFGLAYKDVESTHNGKTFTTRRKLKLGPLIRDLGPGVAEFWDKNNKFYTTKENALYFQERSQFVIVLTRHPIDIVRMSDHEGITSCHSVGGDYFKCAVTEARKGGAVAYVIRKEDLEEKQMSSRGKMMPAPDLQGKDFFYDEDRDVGDIEPIARLRIRQVRNVRTGMTLAIPENRIYGRNMILLATQVKNFLLDKQKDKINSLKNKEIDLAQYSLLGGSYEDNYIEELFIDFLKNIDSINFTKDHGWPVSRPADDHFGESFYDKAEEYIQDNYRGSAALKEYNFSFDNLGDDDDTISIYASFRFNFKIKQDLTYKEENKVVSIFNDVYEIYDHNVQVSSSNNDFFIIEISETIYDSISDLESFLDFLVTSYNQEDSNKVKFRIKLEKAGLAKNSLSSSMINFKPKNLEKYITDGDEYSINISFQKGSFIELQKITEKYPAYRTKLVALRAVEKYNEILLSYIKNFINSHNEETKGDDAPPAQQSLNFKEDPLKNVKKRKEKAENDEAKKIIEFEINSKFNNAYYDNFDTTYYFLNYIFYITIENPGDRNIEDAAIKLALQTVNMIDKNIYKFKQEAENFIINEIENNLITIK